MSGMKVEKYKTVSEFLGKIPDKEMRGPYVVHLTGFCRLMRKSPDALVAEARKLKRRWDAEEWLESKLTNFLVSLERRGINEFYRREAEYAVRQFFQTHGLPVDISRAKRRLREAARRFKEQRKAAEAERKEIRSKIAKKMGIDVEEFHPLSSHSELYVDDTGRPRLKVGYSLFSGRDAELDEDLDWYVTELWKPRIDRLVSLAERRTPERIQLRFYKILAEKMGLDVDALLKEWIIRRPRRDRGLITYTTFDIPMAEEISLFVEAIARKLRR